MIDIRWLKNQHRIVNKVYVSPTYHGMPPAPSTAPDSGTPWALNDKLRDVDADRARAASKAPEDVILDRDDNLYAGSRHGDIMRFFPPDYQRMEVFAHIGGTPLGHGLRPHDNLYVCIGGMGLYRVTPERKVEKVTDETNRSLCFGQRRQPAAAGRRSRHRRRRAHLLLRSHRALRDARVGRSTGSKRAATAASSATTRTAARRTPCCAT